MTIKSISDRDRERDETARAQSPQEAVDRLAGLLPDEALEDALKGLSPEQITGPGGLLTQLAGTAAAIPASAVRSPPPTRDATTRSLPGRSPASPQHRLRRSDAPARRGGRVTPT